MKWLYTLSSDASKAVVLKSVTNRFLRFLETIVQKQHCMNCTWLITTYSTTGWVNIVFFNTDICIFKKSTFPSTWASLCKNRSGIIQITVSVQLLSLLAMVSDSSSLLPAALVCSPWLLSSTPYKAIPQLSIYLLERQLKCFYLGIITNKDTMNFYLQVICMCMFSSL